MSRGQLDRRTADRPAPGNTIWLVAFSASAVLINGLLAILGIEALQAVGEWATGGFTQCPIAS